MPQGSVLGPLGFNIFLNEFAILDDTQLFLRRLKPSKIQTSLQSGLTLASDSFQGNGMTTNPNKCLSMWFGTDTDDLSVYLMALSPLLLLQCYFLVSVSIKILISTFMLRRPVLCGQNL